MGVHRITSEAAKYYALKEKIIGTGIVLFGEASEKVGELSKEDLEKLGDLAAALLPHTPGNSGKLMVVVARLFWALAGVTEREFKILQLEEIEKMVEELKSKIGSE
ncbi:hypothetical protein Asulf_00200 [Archaeoglobus sulfaticallidus PM70-1]|uniref:Uncharacterized protein n=1 Tax=Archaeoglobus sulfaticallidus PM70-1 TaxID=387631 RepID=N0B9E9_9EURY|nr:hypothetical protein [Archaeoglobus sulfaticallidus]AGK60234.1 hypothetical protein Asulf_00200 [Archaeoglobus sulfaticallidus PM70-1]